MEKETHIFLLDNEKGISPSQMDQVRKDVKNKIPFEFRALDSKHDKLTMKFYDSDSAYAVFTITNRGGGQIQFIQKSDIVFCEDRIYIKDYMIFVRGEE